MKRVIAVALVLAVLGWTVPAHARIGTIDQVPAATLLLPYFEVDLDNTTGVTTLFSINNASATAVLAHVVLWTDLSVPTLAFDVYLTGYDVQTINVRDIFNGVLPRTASAGQDPNDTISPQGPVSQDINFASCNGDLPPAVIPAAVVTGLQNAHTGQPSAELGGQCAGGNYGDRIARGYITVDTVNACNVLFPGDPGYFAPGGTGFATNQNILWGDYFYVNSGQNFAQGETLVHIEAAPGTGVSGTSGTYGPDPETTVTGNYTFYGRYTAWSAADNREPLATNFAVRYIVGGVFDGGTDLIVWRDSKLATSAFACPVAVGARPPWFPLGQEAIVVFDEQENATIPVSIAVAPQVSPFGILPFALEAQRMQVGSVNFPVSFNFGWMYLNLNVTVTPAGAVPPEDPAAAQAWVSVVHDAEGRFSVGYNATQLDNASRALHSAPGP